MNKKTIFTTVLAVIFALAIFWYIGANPRIAKIGDESTTLRTVQAIDFTVQSPYSWTRDFVSIPQLEKDITVIPQGISDDKPFMVLYPAGEMRKVRILFSVNDLSSSELSLEKYVQIVEEAMNQYQDFHLISKKSDLKEYNYEYSYSNAEKDFLEIKKFYHKDGKLLIVIATIEASSAPEYVNLTREIIKTANLR
ncbi:MAG: hypothetical protein AABX53_04015 [Nanoarchaeota archaeon]